MSANSSSTRHNEAQTNLPAGVEEVFRYLDDYRSLSAHMTQPSWRLGGGSMQVQFDEGGGRDRGSHVRWSGRAFWIPLFVEEVVSDRRPPFRKEWETLGTPKLLVIGSYRMGFEIVPDERGARLRVFIDYSLPSVWPYSWLAGALAEHYARWCVGRMTQDAVRHFSTALHRA